MNKQTDTEAIDTLFLELSQFTQATTGKELKLKAEIEKLVTAISPFAALVTETSGRIPSEHLSAANWHLLTTRYLDAVQFLKTLK